MKESSFDTAYKKVKELVAKFKQGEQSYLLQSYSEAAVRQDFLDNFFTALGWDVRHQVQHDTYEQEVKIEQGVKVSGAQKRADYSFAIAPNFRDSKFFAEAKKPAKALRNAQDYFQSIRYGWHKGHPLSVLTDFEEFHILDCRYTPDINNSLDKCYKCFHYTDYLNKEKFAEIYWLFSREAVANNSIEKITDSLPKKKGKAAKTLLHQTIDDAFLEVIDGIRETLAKAFKKQDENLSSEQLTEATHRTVDRLVFIRFLEDKLIEQEHYVSEFGGISSLQKGAKGDSAAWQDFISTCRKLDAKYNGIVFKEHFTDEQNFAGPEASEFRAICQDICHLNSRFLFNEIPIHILGSIYERFLGKVVHTTDKRVKVEEKPEVRKAGGVYYTPKYIVDYIVNNTVGKLIEGKTPEQISKLRFADIACGSGSFLIGVFDCLLDYHNKYYQKHPDKAKKDGCIQKDGLWTLSIKQKQKILLNNIYGVDIDQQATEVTQLSLALKMMEDETTATANEMQVLFHEKILPDMSKNIICGNSLIGTDILTFNGLFSGEEERKLSPMDFETTFSEVFRSTTEKRILNLPDEIGDAENLPQAKEPMVSYERKIKGGFDAIVGNPPYVGIHQFIVNTNYFGEKYLVAKGQYNLFSLFIEKALHNLKEDGLFGYIIPSLFIKGVQHEPLRLFINASVNAFELIEYGDKVFKGVQMPTCTLILKKGKGKKNINYFENKSTKLFSKNDTIPLANISVTSRGLEIGRNKLVEDGKVKCIVGGDLDVYFIKNTSSITEKTYKEFKKVMTIFKSPKILVRETGNRLFSTIDYDDLITTRSIYNIKITDRNFSSEFVLGIINSTLFKFYFRNFIAPDTSIFPKIRIAQLKELPIPAISIQTQTEKATHDKIVALVEQMLEAKKEIKTAKTDKDKTYYGRTCSSLNVAIDAEVYKLYDLSEEEIAIIENNNK